MAPVANKSKRKPFYSWFDGLTDSEVDIYVQSLGFKSMGFISILQTENRKVVYVPCGSIKVTTSKGNALICDLQELQTQRLEGCDIVFPVVFEFKLIDGGDQSSSLRNNCDHLGLLYVSPKAITYLDGRILKSTKLMKDNRYIKIRTLVLPYLREKFGSLFAGKSVNYHRYPTPMTVPNGCTLTPLWSVEQLLKDEESDLNAYCSKTLQAYMQNVIHTMNGLGYVVGSIKVPKESIQPK